MDGGRLVIGDTEVLLRGGWPTDRASGTTGSRLAGDRLEGLPDHLRAARPARTDADLRGQHPNGAIAIAALGWLTIDPERSARDLGLGTLGQPLEEPVLGARRWPFARSRVLLLEPVTEGRVAAALARSGEGPGALYVAVLARSGRGESPSLVRPERPWGPFVLLVPDR